MKKYMITIMAAMALCLAANSQEVMKVELKNGQVATFPVEDINRFYFEGAQQQEELAPNCEISIVDELVMTNTAAFELQYGNAVDRVFVGWTKAEGLEELSDNEIIELLVRYGESIGKDNNYAIFGGLDEGTDIVFTYVAFNSAGKHGQLYCHRFTTKMAANELKAVVNPIIEYNDQYFTLQIQKSSSNILDYFVWVQVGNDFQPLSINIAEAGLKVLKKSIEEGTYDAHYYDDQYVLLPRPNGENSFRIFTWARDLNGNLSGVLETKMGTVSGNTRQIQSLISSDSKPTAKYHSKEELMKMFDFKKVSVLSEQEKKE